MPGYGGTAEGGTQHLMMYVFLAGSSVIKKLCSLLKETVIALLFCKW